MIVYRRYPDDALNFSSIFEPIGELAIIDIINMKEDLFSRCGLHCASHVNEHI